MVGANTGCKTGLVRRHVQEAFDDRYIATLGTKVSIKRLRMEDVAGIPRLGLDILLWDIESRREFRTLLIDAYLRGTSGILAVADMARRTSLEDVADWIRDVENVAGDVPVVVIGADRDPGTRREVSEDDVRRLAESYGAACFFASANSQEPVEEAFLILAERIVSRRLRGRAARAGTP